MIGNGFKVTLGLDEELYPATNEWTAELEDPENGTVTLTVREVFGPSLYVEVNDIHRPTGIILKDPDGKEYRVPLEITKEDGKTSVTY